jgi:hypothetical protein
MNSRNSMDTKYLYKLSNDAQTLMTEAPQLLRNAAIEIETLRRTLKLTETNYQEALDNIRALECAPHSSSGLSDLRAAQRALGYLHERLGVELQPTTGSLAGDIRSLAEALKKFCQKEELISAGHIKAQLQEITRRLP